MKTGYGLELLQTQKLNLTPEMRQAITVLQMSAVELRQFILSQVEENPLIDLVEDCCEESLPDQSDGLDEDLLSYFLDSSDLGHDLSRNVESPKNRTYESLAAERKVSLKDHLLAQMGIIDLSVGEYLAAETIIGSLDDNGYLRCSVDEICVLCSQPKDVVQKMLETIQSFDPPGVGAADLRECLFLQAKARGTSDFQLRLIDAHLEDLAAGRYRKIAREESVALEDVLCGRDVVLSLDPKPGSRFSSTAVTYVVPEIAVRKVNGEVQVALNENALPKLRWNLYYRNLARAGDREAKVYLLNEIKRAQSLFRCIEQRKNTIMRVMDAIVARQETFFDMGPGYLEPLTMKDISEEVGVHESTVSRAVANKYVDTAYGVFACRTFFNPRVRTGNNELSQDAVKTAILEIVRTEDNHKPLGDQEISSELEKRGMKVARRTVSKYRSQLGIMPKSKRKGI